MMGLKINRKYILIAAIMLLVMFFAFGCKVNTPVESLNFDLTNFHDADIVLLVGDEFKPKVNLTPSFASNKNYTLTSSNTDIISVSGSKIKALAEGEAYITAISNDNHTAQDSVLIYVKNKIENLTTPQNLIYNPLNNSLSFDVVPNAVDYSLEINGQLENIGNNTTFTLNSTYFDKVLSIKVRANAPTYSHAFASSGFSNAIKIYQTSPVENINVAVENGNSTLTFSHKTANKFNLFVGDESWQQVENKSVSLMNLNSKFANKNVEIKIEALVDDEIKNLPANADVTFYSAHASTQVYVLDEVKLEINANILTWQNLANASGYTIFVDDDKKSETQTNSFDLSTLNLQPKDGHYSVKVEPKLTKNNLAKTEQTANLKFNILPAPTLNLEQETVNWVGEGFYCINLTSEEQVLFSSTEQTTTFNFDFENGNYELSVQKMGEFDENESVYYLNSSPAILNITKQNLTDYAVNFSAEIGEEFIAKLNGEQIDAALLNNLSNARYDAATSTLTAQGKDVTINFANAEFEAGEQLLTLISENNAIICKFLQLSKIESISINDMIVSVDNEQNAGIKFEVCNNLSSVVATVTEESFKLETLNEQDPNFLASGEYTIKVYVLGNGSSTIGVRKSGSEIETATAKFTVLPAPNLILTSSSSKQIKFEKIDNAQEYKLFEKQGEEYGEYQAEILTDTTCTFDFELEAGSISLAAIAVGNNSNLNGECYLSSCYGKIEISYLNEPTLQFNKDSQKFEILDDNDETKVDNYLIEYNTQSNSFSNKGQIEFNPEFEVGQNVFKITANAKDEEVNGVFYLDATSEIEINKIDANPNILILQIDDEFALEVDKKIYFNYLQITPQNLTEEHDLILTLKVGEQSFVFKTQSGSLNCEESGYNLPYQFDGTNYFVALNTKDFSPIVTELISASTFDVSVVFEAENANEVSSIAYTKTLNVLKASTLRRQAGEQAFEFVNVDARVSSGYAILIDQEYVINIDEDLTNRADEQDYFVLPFSFVESKLTELGVELGLEKHSISILTINVATDANKVGLALNSNAIYFALTGGVQLETSKQTSGEDTDVNLYFSTYQTDYAKSYVAEFYTKEGEQKQLITSTPLTENLIKDDVLTFKLDDSFNNEVYVSVYVLTSGNKTEIDQIEMFNSKYSNELFFKRVNAATTFYISKNVLYIENEDFNLIASYDIYLGENKIGSAASKEVAEFALPETVASGNLCVKAIALNEVEGQLYANSKKSQTKQVVKPTLELATQNGDFVLTISNFSEMQTMFEEGNAYLKIENKQNDELIKLNEIYYDAPEFKDGVKFMFEQNKILVEAYKVLKYAGSEKLIFNLVFETSNKEETTYYVSPNSKEISGSGLASPTDLDVKYSQLTDNSEKVDKISFKNPNEQLCNYVVRLTYEERTHYSTEGIFYFNEEAINASNLITEPQFKLPTKFVSGDVTYQFEYGSYLLEIKVVPNGEGTNFSSGYTAVKIEILNPVELSVVDGNIIWQGNKFAQSYSINAYEVSGESEEDWTYLTTIHTTDTSFNFESGIEKSGLIALSVQAISDVKAETEEENDTKSYTINSIWSEKLVVYKLPEIEQAYIDDGFLVLKASKYFNKANIQFVGGAVNYSFEFNREEEVKNLYEQLAAKGDWQQVEIEDPGQLFIINLNDDGTFNVLENQTYAINVSLIGNTADEENGYLPVVNSSKTLNASNLKATKLKKSNNQVGEQAGQFVFAAASSYNNLNYQFGESETADQNMLNALVYKINLSVLNETETNYSIYALDYNYFNSLVSENKHEYSLEEVYGNLIGYYILNKGGEEIKLSVFKNNTIDFQEKTIYYNKINVEQKEGKIIYSTDEGGSPTAIDLSNGGTFVLDVFVLGGDSFVNTQQESVNMGYLTSQLVENYFIRYAPNKLQTKNGEIIFKNLIKYDHLGAVDYPVYKIVAQTAVEKDKKVFYLYYEDEQNAKQVAVADNQKDSEIGVFEKIMTDADSEDYIWFEISKYLESKTYSLTIQTLAGSGSENVNAKYLLNSLQSSSKNVSKLTDAELSANLTRGVRLNIAKSSTQEGLFSNDYEITIIDNDKNYTYLLNSSNENVVEQNNNLIYTLPINLTTIEGQEISLDCNKTYKIKVRALAGSENVINGTYQTELVGGEKQDKTLNIQIAKKAEQVMVSEGVLKYKIADDQNYLGVLVKMGYLADAEQGEVEKYLIFENIGSLLAENWCVYQFRDGNDYLFEGSTSSYGAITAENAYKLKLSVYGETLYEDDHPIYVLNSDYYVLENTMRQASVDAQSIKAESGLLTWAKSENARAYQIEVALSNVVFRDTTVQTSYDLSTKIEPNDNYSISIRALGDDKINAINSTSQIKFIKLNSVDSESLKINASSITWNAVDNATGYNVTISYQSSEGQKNEPSFVASPSFNLPDDLAGNYILTIQACGNNSNILSSSTITYSSSAERPQPINSIDWDETNARFVIVPSTDFKTNDTIEITYRLNKYNYLTGTKDDSETRSSYTITYTGAEQYYFEPKIMGVYLRVYAVVNRPGSASSNRIEYLGGQMDLHLFAAGDGETEPYKIENATQLLNVGLRKTSKFVITSSINLSLIQEQIKQNLSKFGAALANEFAGEISGSYSNTKHAITGFNFEITNSNFALFNKLNNAVIKDIILGNGTVATINANYANKNGVSLAILANESSGATIQNVSTQNIKIAVTGQAQGEVLVAGLVASATNSNFVNCNVETTIEYSLLNVVTKYVGGLVAKAVGGKFETEGINTGVTFNVASSVSNSNAISYLGGIVGKYESNSSSLGYITNYIADVTMTGTNALNVGGLAGYTSYVTISNSSVVGSIATNDLVQTNLGGLVGKMQSSTINLSGVGSQNKTFAINAKIGNADSGNVRIGVLVGELSKETESNKTNNLSSCYSYTEFATGQTTLNPYKLGVYGYNQTGSSIIGSCEKR